MPTCLIAGGGLAGLSCAAALADAGFCVDLFEARPFLGGRAASYFVRTGGGTVEIDNCQHILLRCCVNLLDFYRRLGVDDKIRFYDTIVFLEPGGRRSVLRAGPWPEPFHFTGSLARLRFLGWRDKAALVRAMKAVRRDWPRRSDLDRITFLDWLREKRQTRGATERFWEPVIVSALNESPARVAARHGLQVVWLGFLARRDNYQLGVPAVSLGRLYHPGLWRSRRHVRLHLGEPVERFVLEGGRVAAAVVGGEPRRADYYVSAVDFDRAAELLPELELDTAGWERSPITGIHLWFDRPVTTLPHAALLGRTIQWFFDRGEGRYLQLVVSASRALLPMSRGAIVELAVRELAEFLPAAGEAKLERSHVVKELRATVSPAPGIEPRRPGTHTRWPNFFLAGDWTRSGWPSTMEGAVRSGYLAAEAVTNRAGRLRRYLLPERQ